MFCSKCGKQNPDDSSFCLYCGAQISSLNSALAPKQEPVSASMPYSEPAASTAPNMNFVAQNNANGAMSGNSLLCNSDEFVVSSLNAYSKSGITQCTLTNKRVYISGKLETARGLSRVVTDTEKIIEVDEISESCVTSLSKPAFLAAMFFSLMVGIIVLVFGTGASRSDRSIFYIIGGSFIFYALLFLISYFTSKRSTFCIIYTNGAAFINFLPGQGVNAVKDFQKHVHVVRDELKAQRGK